MSASAVSSAILRLFDPLVFFWPVQVLDVPDGEFVPLSTYRVVGEPWAFFIMVSLCFWHRNCVKYKVAGLL